MRILALVPGDISDQILFFPTIDDLKTRYPQAQIDVVVEPRAKDAYQVSKSVRETIVFDYIGRNSLADWGNLLGIIRDREYEVVLTYDDRWSTGLLLWLSGIPARLGFAGGPSELYLTAAVTPDPQKKYIADRYHDLLKGMDLQGQTPELAVNVPTQDLAWADAERKRLGLSNGGYVMVWGNGNSANSMYPTEQWQLVLKDFQKKQPDLPLVLADSGDGSWMKALTDLMPTLKVTRPNNAGQAVALFAGASLLLCCESAAMHLAIAAKTFTLVLLSDSDPKLVLPQSDRVIALKSSGRRVGEIAPSSILEKVWGG
jgi:ADP-heptose:LPS heptosyltransferase